MNALWSALALAVLVLLLQVGGVVGFPWFVWFVVAAALVTGAAVAVLERHR